MTKRQRGPCTLLTGIEHCARANIADAGVGSVLRAFCSTNGARHNLLAANMSGKRRVGVAFQYASVSAVTVVGARPSRGPEAWRNLQSIVLS